MGAKRLIYSERGGFNEGACSSTIRDTLHELLPPDPLSLHGLLLPLFLHSLLTPSLVLPRFSESAPPLHEIGAPHDFCTHFRCFKLQIFHIRCTNPLHAFLCVS